MKDFRSTQKYVRSTPRKLRLVAGMIKKMEPGNALDYLAVLPQKAAVPLAKTIRTAVANAKYQGVTKENLAFKEIQIGEAKRLKRGRPVARGRWHPVLKRTSHIRVVLTTQKPQAPNTKLQTNSKVKTKNEKK